MGVSSSRELRIALFLALLVSVPAVAQRQDGPAGISVEPLVIYPGLDLSLGHDDNLFSSNIFKKESAFAILSPWVRIEGKPTPHQFDLNFRYDIGRYDQSTQDDYEDYRLDGNVLAIITGRADIKVHAEYVYGHDPRGSTDRPAGNNPDEFVNGGADAVFGYGAPGAQGRVELNGGFYTRRYQNNRTFTIASDHDTGTAGGTFLWRVGPRSQLLFQTEGRRLDYDQPTSTLDSTETRVYVGARWEATAKTSGFVKFGGLKKAFESNTREDFSTGSWDVGVVWSPLTYSVFNFITSRQTEESTGVGDTIVSNLYNLAWTHHWSGRFRSRLMAGWKNDDFRGQGVTREDETATVGLGLHYQFRRWLRLSADYIYTDRDSNEPTVIYERNVYYLTLAITL